MIIEELIKIVNLQVESARIKKSHEEYNVCLELSIALYNYRRTMIQIITEASHPNSDLLGQIPDSSQEV